MDALAWAMELYAYGFSVIPMLDKKPMIAWKKLGLANRRPTENEIQSWFQNPCNIGILTGKYHGVVVVDGDTPDAVEYIESVTGGSPMKVITSKGAHLYFRHCGHPVKSLARIVDDPPVDIRGDGGVATAPGSIHASGIHYHLADGCDLVCAKELPIYNKGWFPEPTPDIPPRRVQYSSSSNRAARYLDAIPGAGSGARNQQTFRAATASIRDFGVDYDEGLALLNNWNETKNDPPLAMSEVKTILDSAMQGGRKYPIGWRAS